MRIGDSSFSSLIHRSHNVESTRYFYSSHIQPMRSLGTDISILLLESDKGGNIFIICEDQIMIMKL